MNKKTSVLVGILIIAIVVVGWRLLSKGGLFAIQLPQPIKVQTAESLSGSSASAVATDGAVLGESTDPNYVNPLKDIYVNPFQK